MTRTATSMKLSLELRGCDVTNRFFRGWGGPEEYRGLYGSPVLLLSRGNRLEVDADELGRIVVIRAGALVYGANFSVGVQVFYRISATAAKFVSEPESYDSFIEEGHHKKKPRCAFGNGAAPGKNCD